MKKAAKAQAAATLTAAENTAANDRVIAQGAQQTQETLLAQNAATKSAGELLALPQGDVDVRLAADDPSASVDPKTNRRRTTRSTFMSSKSPGSGIKIA